MEDSLQRKQKHKRNLSDWILDHDKKTYTDINIKNESKNILIDSFNECSDLRRSFHDNLRTIFRDMGFSSMKNIHENGNNLTLDFPSNDRNTKYCYNGEITVIKNNSVSKFGIKNNKIYSLNKNDDSQQNMPQTKVISSLRKKVAPKEDFNEYENDYYDKNRDIQEKKYEIKMVNKYIDTDRDKENDRNYGQITRKEIYTKEIINAPNENEFENDDDYENGESITYLKKIDNFGKNKFPEKSEDKIINSIFSELVKVKSPNKENDDEIEEQEEEDNYNENYFKIISVKHEPKDKKTKNTKNVKNIKNTYNIKNQEEDLSDKRSNSNSSKDLGNYKKGNKKQKKGKIKIQIKKMKMKMKVKKMKMKKELSLKEELL